jgi:hypothetical protein
MEFLQSNLPSIYPAHEIWNRQIDHPTMDPFQHILNLIGCVAIQSQSALIRKSLCRQIQPANPGGCAVAAGTRRKTEAF